MNAPAENAQPPIKLWALIVEDHAINQLVAEKMLEQIGFSSVVVANGLLAMEQLKARVFDIIILDCQMPEMDGYQTTEAIRSDKSTHFCEIPIIAVTASCSKEDKIRCLKLGMNAYLPKPIEYEDLRSTVIKLCKLPSA